MLCGTARKESLIKSCFAVSYLATFISARRGWTEKAYRRVTTLISVQVSIGAPLTALLTLPTEGNEIIIFAPDQILPRYIITFIAKEGEEREQED